MLLIEATLRGGVIALILVLGALAARDARRFVLDRYSTLFALSGIAYLIESAPALASQHDWWLHAIRAVSIATPAVFWVWVKAQMDDPFVPAWRNWLPWLGMIALGSWAMANDLALPWQAVRVASLTLVGLGIWKTLAGRGGDLVEGRRRLRLVLAIGAAAYIGGIEFITVHNHGVNGLMTTIGLEAALAAYVAFGLAARITRPATAAEAPPAARPAQPLIVDPEEARLLEALRRIMEEDKAYREERCGIASLAARLGIPEYRLRRLINQRLGHRNFTTYVNGYRLAEAAAALADPAQVRVPIITIALDAGFQSLGPFNRAFKAHTGMTPSEFRRDRLGEPADAPEPVALSSPIPKSAGV